MAPDESTAIVRVDRPPRTPGVVVVAICGTTTGVDVASVCDELRAELDGGAAEIVVCDVSALVAPDAVTVDVVARLALTARRAGSQLQLRHASRDLRRLVAFMGLGGALGLPGIGPVFGAEDDDDPTDDGFGACPG